MSGCAWKTNAPSILAILTCWSFIEAIRRGDQVSVKDWNVLGTEIAVIVVGGVQAEELESL